MNQLKKFFKKENNKNILMVIMLIIMIISIIVSIIAITGNGQEKQPEYGAWNPADTVQPVTDDESTVIRTEDTDTQEIPNDTIVIWDIPGNDILINAIEEFKSKRNNVEIIVEHSGLMNSQQFESEIAVGRGPDIIYLDQVYSVSMGEQGLIKDLNEFGANKLSNQFVKSAFNSVSYNKKQYALPFDSNTIALMYNKTAFKDANAKVPTTYKELIDASNKLKKKFGGTYSAYTAPFYKQEHKNWLVFNYFFYLWRMGGDVLSDDLKSAAFNNESGIEALEMIIDMKNKGIIDAEYREEEFFDGRGGMIDNGTWQMNNITGNTKKAEIGIALLPTLKKGVKPYSGLGLNCYAIAKSSKNPQLAYDFLEFYCTSSKYQSDFSKLRNLIPTLKQAQNDNFYNTPEWETMIKQLDNSKYRPSVPNWEKIEEIIAEAVILSLNGDYKPKDALNRAAQNVNKELK